MAGTPVKAGPAYVTTGSVNQFTVAAGTYVLVRHIHITNTSGSTRTYTAYLGASGAAAAGTEIVRTRTLSANGTSGDTLDVYFPQGLRMATTDFITATAGTDSTSLVSIITYEAYAV